jgi:hypothetical protein
MKKGNRYCNLLYTLIKKFDILNIIDNNNLDILCSRLSLINGSLQKCYSIIFNRGLSRNKAINHLKKITDHGHNYIINSKQAEEIYDKFKKIQFGGDINEPPNINNETKQIINKTFDMMEILLITLSLLPIAGWTFDFPLFIYAVSNKKYTLAIITVLNWYIWSFWLLFGVNMNIGPTLKSGYLGNNSNVVKNILLNPTKLNLPKNNKLNAKLTEINGDKYLVDSNKEVYNRDISGLKPIGILDTDNNLVEKTDPTFWEVKQQYKNKS